MKILALDSTAKVAAAALCENEILIAQESLNAGLTHSETLLPMIERLLKKAGVSINDIGLFACSGGPGSFTGVRIGAATVKGLAFGKGKPCVAVSSLLALAYNMREANGIVCSAMDARRSQLYYALFEVKNGDVIRLCADTAQSEDSLAADFIKYADKSKKVFVVGDGAAIARDVLCRHGIGYESIPEERELQNGYSVALCAYRAYLSGETVSDLTLVPSYLRLPQAERERIEKDKNNISEVK